MGLATDKDSKKISDGDDMDTAEGAPEDDSTEDAAGESKEATESDGPLKADSDDAAAVDEHEKPAKNARRVSFSIRSLGLSALVVGLIAALGVMTWLFIGANEGLDHQTQQANDVKRAEKVALDYAVNAAVMDYHDLGPWKQNIVKGTTPQLSDKLSKAATAMEQIVLPLQWTSTAKPLAAKVRSVDKGVYVVDAFVAVMTKTVQATDELQSTATYAVTVDSNNAWQINDVGGIAAVVDK